MKQTALRALKRCSPVLCRSCFRAAQLFRRVQTIVIECWISGRQKARRTFCRNIKIIIDTRADTAIWLGYERGESLLHHAVCQLNGELPPFLTKSDYVPDFGSTISDVMSRIAAAPEPDPKGNPFAISDGGGIGYRAHFSSRFGLLVISLCFIYVPK